MIIAPAVPRERTENCVTALMRQVLAILVLSSTVSSEAGALESVLAGGIGYYGGPTMVYADFLVDKADLSAFPLGSTGSFVMKLPIGVNAQGQPSSEGKSSSLPSSAKPASSKSTRSAVVAKFKHSWDSAQCVLVERSNDLTNAVAMNIETTMRTVSGQQQIEAKYKLGEGHPGIADDFSVICSVNAPTIPNVGTDEKVSNTEVSLIADGKMSGSQYTIQTDTSGENRITFREVEPLTEAGAFLYASGDIEDPGFGLKLTMSDVTVPLNSFRIKAQNILEFGPATHTRGVNGEVISGAPADCDVIVNGEERRGTALIWADSTSEVQFALSDNRVVPIGGAVLIKCKALSARKPVSGLPTLVRVMDTEGSHESGAFIVLKSSAAAYSFVFLATTVVFTVLAQLF